MHLLDDILRSISDAWALALGWAFAIYHWFVGDMSPLSALGAMTALALTIGKLWELKQKRRDMLFLKEAFEAAEEGGDNETRAAAVRLMRSRRHRRRCNP